MYTVQYFQNIVAIVGSLLHMEEQNFLCGASVTAFLFVSAAWSGWLWMSQTSCLRLENEVSEIRLVV